MSASHICTHFSARKFWSTKMMYLPQPSGIYLYKHLNILPLFWPSYEITINSTNTNTPHHTHTPHGSSVTYALSTHKCHSYSSQKQIHICIQILYQTVWVVAFLRRREKERAEINSHAIAKFLCSTTKRCCCRFRITLCICTALMGHIILNSKIQTTHKYACIYLHWWMPSLNCHTLLSVFTARHTTIYSNRLQSRD